MSSVTKPRKKNLGGRPRIHASDAAKQKAYRDRKKRAAKRVKANVAGYWKSVTTAPAVLAKKKRKTK